VSDASIPVVDHYYSPDYQAMGDCRVCGHHQAVPWHLGFTKPLPTGLKPQNLIQAAEADFDRRTNNLNVNRGHYQQYAFHRDHVARAMSVRELLILALMSPPLKTKDGETFLDTVKPNTRLIYGNAQLLLAAIRMLS
jgi:hypothetical protein